MAKPLRRVAVLTHLLADSTAAALRELAEVGAEYGLQLLLPTEEAAKHPLADELGYRRIGARDLHMADLCLVFGGDGSILRALGRLLGSGVPTLGVNFGNVGFLASLPQERWRDGLAGVLAGRYQVAELLTVEARLPDGCFAAVNDVVLSRPHRHGVLHLEYAIAGASLGGMRCDGMIVATPTGSTAYNLSCGGPLVVWDASVLVLNFVAPHSLGFRPLVLRPEHVIEVCNAGDVSEAEVVVDGRVVGVLSQGDCLRIGASPLRALLLLQEGASFYRNVEEKLFGFGADAR